MADYKHVLVVRTADTLADTMLLFPKATPFAIAKTIPEPITIPEQTELLVLTSQNAVPTLPKTHLPLVVVGEQTAQIANQHSLNVVATGHSDAAGLVAVLKNRPEKNILHVHGNDADINWHQQLQSPQKITGLQGYTTQYCTELPPEIIHKLQEKQLTRVTLWSAQAAHHLHKLLKQAKINAREITAFCLSPQVAQAAAGFGQVVVAPEPNRNAMKKMVD